MMRSLYAIYRKEMGHYFVSPVAYVVVAMFLYVSAYFFNLYVREIVEQSFGMPADFDAPAQVLRAFLGLLALRTITHAVRMKREAEEARDQGAGSDDEA